MSKQYNITEIQTHTNGQAKFKSSDVATYLSMTELNEMKLDMMFRKMKNEMASLIKADYFRFFTQTMNNIPQMVRAIELRIQELEHEEITKVYDTEWPTIQIVKPIKMNKIVK